MRPSLKATIEWFTFTRRTSTASETYRTCATLYFTYAALLSFCFVPMLFGAYLMALEGYTPHLTLRAFGVVAGFIGLMVIAGSVMKQKSVSANFESDGEYTSTRFGIYALLALVIVPFVLPRLLLFVLRLVMPGMVQFYGGYLFIELMAILSETPDSTILSAVVFAAYWLLWGLRVLAIWYALLLWSKLRILSKPPAKMKVTVGRFASLFAFLTPLIDTDRKLFLLAAWLLGALAAILIVPIAAFHAYYSVVLGESTPLLDIWLNGGARAGSHLVPQLLATIGVYASLAIVTIFASAKFLFAYRRCPKDYRSNAAFRPAFKHSIRWLGILLLVGVPILYAKLRSEPLRSGVPHGLEMINPRLLFISFNLEPTSFVAASPPFARFWNFQCIPLILLGVVSIGRAQVISVRESEIERMRRGP